MTAVVACLGLVLALAVLVYLINRSQRILEIPLIVGLLIGFALAIVVSQIAIELTGPAASDPTKLTDTERQSHENDSKSFDARLVAVKTALSTLITKVQTDDAARDNAIAQLTDTIRPLPEQIKQLSDQTKPLPNQIKQLSEQIKPLPDQIKQLNDQTKPLPDRITQLSGEIKPLPGQIADHGVRLKAIENQLPPPVLPVTLASAQVRVQAPAQGKPLTTQVVSQITTPPGAKIQWAEIRFCALPSDGGACVLAPPTKGCARNLCVGQDGQYGTVLQPVASRPQFCVQVKYALPGNTEATLYGGPLSPTNGSAWHPDAASSSPCEPKTNHSGTPGA